MFQITETGRALLDFERALRQRNPTLADRLDPGLTETRVQRMLQRAKVEGAIEPVVELFAWRNGSRLDPTVALYASPFPQSNYIFMDLEMMIAHFRGFDEYMIYHPRYAKVVGKYFPLFWDGSNSWLAVDLNPLNQRQVVLIEADFEHMIRPAYDSFGKLLEDAIRANNENDKLSCFK